MAEKNALAELAEELNRVDAHEPELWVGHRKAVRKAQRIVAELASCYEPCFPAKSGDDVIDVCRAIAEEKST